MAAPMGGTSTREETFVEDVFRADFKFYKRRKPPPDLSRVIDFSRCEDKQVRSIKLCPPATPALNCLIPVDNWQVFTHELFPGFTFIANPFRQGYEWHWIKRCMADYPLKPNVNNLDAHMDLGPDFDIWQESLNQRNEENSFEKTLLYKLRWVTLGYHHDWNTKKYHPSHRTPMPADLQTLSRYVSACLGWGGYSAEAAIINYYHLDSTLAGHTDHSELDHQSPLISISFGQTALFMLGGPTKATKPITMYIRSGDIVVMEGPARLSYHAVPKILPDSCALHKPIVRTEKQTEEQHEKDATEPKTDTSQEDISQQINILNREITQTLGDLDVTDFWEYLKTSRINMNIRQVVPGGASFTAEENSDETVDVSNKKFKS